MAEKVHKLHKRSSHSAPYKPYGVGTPETLFRLKIKKNQKIHDFRPKKWMGYFLTPPPPPPPLLENLKKVGFKWGGGGSWGVSGPKTHWGMRLLDKIMILQGVKLTIQSLGVGYANRPTLEDHFR